VTSLADIRAALAAHAPQSLTGRRRAAVAVVLHDAGPSPEILFIERAERFGDPWSGQMAFPGGRVDPGDATARAAAERETLEEVGLDLAGAELLGRLGDVDAGVRVVAPLVLSAFVYRTGNALGAGAAPRGPGAARTPSLGREPFSRHPGRGARSPRRLGPHVPAGRGAPAPDRRGRLTSRLATTGSRW
jgi:ADP-ribose pyrophosphatase YjhB (NUDIX family)